MSTNRLAFILGSVVLVVIIAASIVIGTHQSPAAKTKPPTAAQKLASIQQGSDASVNDPLTWKFQNALDDLSYKCKQPISKLGDDTALIHKILKKRGISESYLSIIRHVSAGIPASAGLQDCNSLFAAYATLRIHG